MLDTNIVSDVLRRPAGKVGQRIREVGTESVCISIVTAAELRFGVLKRGALQLADLVDELLNKIDVAAIETPFDQLYAEIRVFLERSGQPIGPNDLMIAAHARARGVILVTANVREFSRVPDLVVENWLS